MTTLLDKLKPATGRQATRAVKYSPFEELVGQGYLLYFGEKFGVYRNQYWLVPQSKPQKYLIDTDHNLGIIEKLLSRLPKTPEQTKEYRHKRNYKHRIDKVMDTLIKLVDENIEMYGVGAVDPNGKTLEVPNSKISEGFETLKRRLISLRSNKHKPRFELWVLDLVHDYKRVYFRKYFDAKS